MKYTTLTPLKTRLNITGATYDTLLTRYIDSVSRQFENFIGRDLSVKEYLQNLQISGRSFVVKNTPIKSITYLRLDAMAWSDIAYDYFEGQIIYLSSEISGKVYAKYEAGYTLEELPDVEEACIAYIAFLYEKETGVEKNIKSESLSSTGDISRTYTAVNEAENSEIEKWQAVLAPYENIYSWII